MARRMRSFTAVGCWSPGLAGFLSSSPEIRPCRQKSKNWLVFSSESKPVTLGSLTFLGHIWPFYWLDSQSKQAIKSHTFRSNFCQFPNLEYKFAPFSKGERSGKTRLSDSLGIVTRASWRGSSIVYRTCCPGFILRTIGPYRSSGHYLLPAGKPWFQRSLRSPLWEFARKCDLLSSRNSRVILA